VQIAGRAADSVKVLGETVFLERVEEAARKWAAAQDAAFTGDIPDLAVAAVPHPRLGYELILAIATGERGAVQRQAGSLDSLNEFLSSILMPYERPRRVVTVAAIPRTPLGKVRRGLLTHLVADLSQPPASP
jgi:fatty-acyl-CoA synthase